MENGIEDELRRKETLPASEWEEASQDSEGEPTDLPTDVLFGEFLGELSGMASSMKSYLKRCRKFAIAVWGRGDLDKKQTVDECVPSIKEARASMLALAEILNELFTSLKA